MSVGEKVGVLGTVGVVRAWPFLCTWSVHGLPACFGFHIFSPAFGVPAVSRLTNGFRDFGLSGFKALMVQSLVF